jgi:serine/threonine protein kinase/Ca2+-binding EF-hand superfamily protein
MKIFDYLRPHHQNFEAKLALHKFDQDEIHVLKKTWQDLADRSNGKGIDKETFLAYFPLHGLLGERLFAQFDSHKRGYIDFDEFIMGLATVCRGTTDEKVHFVFNMYDVSHDNTVSKQELSTLLNHIPREAFVHHHPHGATLGHVASSHNLSGIVTGTVGDQSSVSASDSDKGSVNGDHEHPHQGPGHLQQMLAKEDSVGHWTNQDVVEQAFLDCDLSHEGRLGYEAFKMWVTRNPAIMDYIESILPYSGAVSHHHDSYGHGHGRGHVSFGAGSFKSDSHNSNGHHSEKHPHDKKESIPHLKRIQSRVSLGRSNTIQDAAGEIFSYTSSTPSNRQTSGGQTPTSLTNNNLHAHAASTKPRLSTINSFMGASNGEISPGPMSPFFGGPGANLSRNSSFSAPTIPSGTNSVAGGGGGGIIGPPSIRLSQQLSHGHHSESQHHLAGTIDSEEQTRILLAHAMEITQNETLKAGIAALIETHLAMYNNVMGVGYLQQQPSQTFQQSCDYPIYNPPPNHITADRLNTAEVYRNLVLTEGYLWKKGKSVFHLLSKRFYLLSGNCMYYYTHQSDVRIKGVVFVTGSIIERTKDMEMELRGYYGFEITHQDLCTGEHHRHEKRVLYCRSEEERETWVTALQHAAHVVPIEEDYVLGKELGRGRFSVVCECVHKVTDKHCAVKIIDKATIEPEEKSLLRTEIAVLKLVNHPNIIRLEGLYESKAHIYIVMEMLKGGELFERIVGRPRFTELEAAKLLRPLLDALAYLHDLGIVHRDLKPENILCGEELEDLKIADFGLSKMTLPKEKMDAACGTLSYVAPEVLTMQGYGKEADLWSVGVILFLLLCGKLPFDGDDHNEIIRSTIQADLKVNPSIWNRLTEDAKNMITSLLNKDPKERITAREALKHPFIVNTLMTQRRASMSLPALPVPPPIVTGAAPPAIAANAAAIAALNNPSPSPSPAAGSGAVSSEDESPKR